MSLPHAVVAVPNNIEIDARAQRNALALAAAGYRVTLVGYGTGLAEQGQLCGIDYFLTHDPVPLEPLSFVYRLTRKAFHLTLRRRPPVQVLRVVGKIDGVTRRWKRAFRKVRSAVERTPELPPSPDTWQGMLPVVGNMTEAMLARVVRQQPDVIVCDVHLLPVAHAAAAHFRNEGRAVGVVYDAREFVDGLASDDPRVLEGFPLLEAEFIRSCSSVLTVNDEIAKHLQTKYDLQQRPGVLPNAPIADLPSVTAPVSVRDVIGLDDTTPLLAYAGGLSHHRGLHDVVSALPALPGVHLAVGARRPSSYTLELEEQAERLGVRDRLHFVPFAPTHEVAEYLASATAAVFPFHPVGNHEMASPNKYYESVQARLPILTSNMAWLSERITELGIGEVFEHSNPDSLAAAAKRLLENIESYRTKYSAEMVRQHTFEAHSHVLLDACTQAVSTKRLQALQPRSLDPEFARLRRDMVGQRAKLANAEIFVERPTLRIGTANSGGQSRQWAHALMREHPRVTAESAWVERSQFITFPTDEIIRGEELSDPDWQRRQMERTASRVSHVLSESGRSMFGIALGTYFWDEVDWYEKRGIGHGVVFHGSDIRDPDKHARLERYSPYSEPRLGETADLATQLSQAIEATRPRMQGYEGAKFVTTLDLLDYVPDATWLPLTVDTDAWSSQHVPLGGQQPPVVLHIPSRASLKGTETVDRVCLELQRQGRIRYMNKRGVRPEQMRKLVLQADIVIDQLRIGDFGLTAVEAMSGGRVVVSYIADRVAERYPELPPIVNANPHSLAEVLNDVLSSAEEAQRLGTAGRDYALRWHDGRESAKVLAQFMQLD